MTTERWTWSPLVDLNADGKLDLLVETSDALVNRVDVLWAR